MILRNLTGDECLTAIASVSVGRIGLTSSALPLIIPVNFKLIGESVYFGAMSNSVLAKATHRTVVAFQADSYDREQKTGWTVMAVGPASRVVEPSERARAGYVLADPWARGHAPEEIVRVDLARVSGQTVASP